MYNHIEKRLRRVVMARDLIKNAQETNDINVKDKFGWTLLMFSIAYGKVKDVEFLIENGADVNVRNNDGITTLMLAILNNNLEMVELLLKNGADPLARNFNGETAFEYSKRINADIAIRFMLNNSERQALSRLADVVVKRNASTEEVVTMKYHR